jgi:hypothetical protein
MWSYSLGNLFTGQYGDRNERIASTREAPSPLNTTSDGRQQLSSMVSNLLSTVSKLKGRRDLRMRAIERTVMELGAQVSRR